MRCNRRGDKPEYYYFYLLKYIAGRGSECRERMLTEKRYSRGVSLIEMCTRTCCERWPQLGLVSMCMRSSAQLSVNNIGSAGPRALYEMLFLVDPE